MATDGLSFLPTIKCSDCGVDIEISQLADHVCAPAARAPKAEKPPSPKLDRAETLSSASFNTRQDGPPRSARMPPPPRIDPYTANKPFFLGALSPESNYSDPNNRSALAPGDGKRPFPVARSATSPLPQPPSPELSSNLDSAFPRFPSNRSATSSSPRSRGLEPSPSFDQLYVQPSPLFAPLSARTNGGKSIVDRMDTIAPGPFTGRADDRRPNTSAGPRSPGQGMSYSHKRTATQGSVKSNGIVSNPRSSTTSNVSRGSVFSNGSSGLPSRPKLAGGPFAAMPPLPPPLPPKDEEPEGIDAFLARLQKETLGPPKLAQENRSNTFPTSQEPRDAAEPSARPIDRVSPPRSRTDIDSQSGYTLSSRSYNPGVSNPRQKEDLQPPPSIPNSARDFPTDPVHTPSDSGRSEDSFASSGYRSVASSRSSPPMSEASHSRQASKISHPDYLKDEPVRRYQSPEMFLDPRPAPPQQGSRRARSPEPPVQAPKAPYIGAPESPMDPAIQMGFSYQNQREEPPPLRDPALNTPGLKEPPRMLESRRSPALDMPGPRNPPRIPDSEPQGETSRRPTAAGKGRCRGCSEQIVGKSVKDSSGRLTGRYHKQCFVCQTCRDPFPTAEFYVFDNFPYCEQHYHRLNGSLCRACNRGIEGQYLETDQRLKFHPRCFSCSTCRIVLRDDYYEVGGRNYCERHAYSAVNQRNNYLGPGNNHRAQNLQKRRTRMMMMG